MPVVLRRGEVIESRHRIHAAVSDARGRLIASVGDPAFVTFMRSAAKPIQAVPLVEDGALAAFGLTTEELALCCGSHSAEPDHLTGVRRILERCGVPESALECGPHLPISDGAARTLLRAGGDAEPIHNNCSGKHAGMLALARHRGWPLAGYTRPDHPVQLRMREEVARWTGVAGSDMRTGSDGCGVVTFSMELRTMARAYGALAEAAREGVVGPKTVVEAMVGHPFMVAGTGRLCTRLMSVAGKSIVAKVGAEGLYCVGAPDVGLGVAVKAEDGAGRAAGVAVLRVLDLVGLLSGAARSALAEDLRAPVLNTVGERAAFLEADFDLQSWDSESLGPWSPETRR